MFNKIREKEEKELDKQHEERLGRSVPVARRIMKLVLEKIDVLPMGDDDGKDPQKNKIYHDLCVDILNIYLEEKVRVVDKDLIPQLMLQPFSTIQKIIADSLNHSWDTVLTGLWGKPYGELNLDDVDRELKKGDIIKTGSTPDQVKPAE